MAQTLILYDTSRKTDFQKLLAAFVCALLLGGSVFVADTMARVPAFPGAEGSGRFATGGRGGEVYEVNNLNNSGPGSIVDAVSQGNRTIVFRVSGTIPLGSTILEPKSNTTIAGQTAPGDGICIKGRIHIKDFVHDIIIRYIRVRVDAGAANSSGDAIDIDEGSNIIIDHVTASYSRDEGISCQETSDKVTVQWCIISEALTYESHSYGSLIRGDYGDTKTYHHNLYAHNNSREPRPGNYTASATDPEGLHFDFRNNVIYNWKGNYAGYNDDTSMVSRYNFIGNAYIPGSESTTGYGNKVFRERDKVGYGYFADNSYDGSVPSDPWSLVYFHSSMTSSDINAYKARSYLVPMEPVTTTSPAQAKTDVLSGAGASFPKRDIIDTRIVNDVLNKTGYSIVDTSAQPEGGWPTLNSTAAPTDTDHDGMSDAWESLHGLNPNNAADRNGYSLNADYTNLEVYLTDLIPSQVDWTQRYNGNANSTDYAKDIALDSAGFVIVSGYAKNTATNYDFVTIKYTPYGSIIWTNTYNRSSSNPDYAMAVAVDANSNIIVAGYGYTTATGYDGIIVKYAPGGSQLWAAAYNYSGTSNDRFYDVATDANGNIYAVGKKNSDALLVKYTPDGSPAWVRIYNGAANGYDSFYQLAVDASGSVYACGESAGIGTDQDCLTVKFLPDGTLSWAKTYNGPANGWDLLEAIALDPAGNVYVTGSVETATDSDYVTIKYSPDGNPLWTAFYGYTATGWDEAYAIAVTSDGNVVVTGYSEGTTSADAATVKYNSQTLAQLWATRYNGAGNSADYAETITADNFGNVYALGRSIEENNSTDYLLICYNSNGIELWKTNYNGPGLQTDISTAIATDNNSIYITGYSTGAESNYDYATISLPCSNNNNLLINPGFEFGTMAWSAYGPCNFMASTTARRSGSYSGYTLSRTANWQGISQSLLGKMQVGKTYTISGWMMLENASANGDTIKITLKKTDGSGTNYIPISSTTGFNGEWTPLAGSYTLTVSGTLTSLVLYFEGPAAGVNYYLDDTAVVLYEPPTPGPNATGEIDALIRYQTLEGFGASGGWYENWLVAHPLSSTLYDILFEQLGLDIYRVRNTYDQGGDGAAYIANSKQIAEAAKTRNPSLKFMISAWSPPAYLKSTGSIVGGTLAKDFNDPNNGPSGYVYQRFAQWWADSLTAWDSNSVHADYITMQNEPDIETSYDSCRFKPTEADSNAGHNLACEAVYQKLYSQMGADMPKILVPETMGYGNSRAYIRALIDANHIYGFAHHLYTDGSHDFPDGFILGMQGYAAQYGYKPLLQTEYAKLSGSGLTDFNTAINMARHIHNSLVYESACSYLYWELFWAAPKGLVSLGSSYGSPDYTINPVYYAFKQYSAFTDPNWQRIEARTDSNGLRISAYISPDNNQMSIVIINISDTNIALNFNSPDSFQVQQGDVYRTSLTENCVLVGAFDINTPLTLPKKSITTIALTPTIEPCPDRPAGDLTGDCRVDFLDLARMAEGYVGNTEDYSLLKDIADTWLECGLINQSNCWQ